jgi:hypothetical protein
MHRNIPNSGQADPDDCAGARVDQGASLMRDSGLQSIAFGFN